MVRKGGCEEGVGPLTFGLVPETTTLTRIWEGCVICGIGTSWIVTLVSGWTCASFMVLIRILDRLT